MQRACKEATTLQNCQIPLSSLLCSWRSEQQTLEQAAATWGSRSSGDAISQTAEVECLWRQVPELKGRSATPLSLTILLPTLELHHLGILLLPFPCSLFPRRSETQANTESLSGLGFTSSSGSGEVWQRSSARRCCSLIALTPGVSVAAAPRISLRVSAASASPLLRPSSPKNTASNQRCTSDTPKTSVLPQQG